MSSDIAICVENVGKAYRIWESPAARITSPIMDGMARVLPGITARWLEQRAADSYRDFWALRGINFIMRKGETVGIIGRNGSGKSSLLQIIAGTLQPTHGAVKVHGRVAALLELGSGFNPEFTGRENVRLNAAVLGLTSSQIDRKFNEIETFADIGEFIDQPVKTYSSGMQLRLAFAVQTAVEPDVLIVDEALSVGDEAFSRKCIARINQLRKQGTSLLLVSHSPNLITTLCERALLIDHGELILNTSPKQAIARYHRLIFTGQDANSANPDSGEGDSSQRDVIERTDGQNPNPVVQDESCFDPSLLHAGVVAYEPKGLRIQNPRLVNLRGIQVNCLTHGCDYIYTYEVEVRSDCYAVVCMCGFRSKEGFELGGIRSHPADSSIEHLSAGAKLKVEFRFRCSMLPETFFLNAGVMGVVNGEPTYLHRLVDVVQFRVLPAPELSAAGLIAFGSAATISMAPALGKL